MTSCEGCTVATCCLVFTVCPVLFCFVLFDCNKKIHLYPDYRTTKHTPLLFFLTKQKTAVYPQLISCGASVCV